MLIERAPGLWEVHADTTMLGIHLGSRMTVVRLRDGSLLLHSPVPAAPDLVRAVAELGPVSHVVCPNLYHHLHAGTWHARFPEARLHGPAALRRKRPDLPITDALGAPHADWSGTLETLHVDGSMLDETLFLHAGSRTLVSSDLVENFTTSPHWPTRMYLRISGVHGRVGWSRLLRWIYRDRRAARRSIDALLEHDFDRVVLAHGDVIEVGGRELVREALSFLR